MFAVHRCVQCNYGAVPMWLSAAVARSCCFGYELHTHTHRLTPTPHAACDYIGDALLLLNIWVRVCLSGLRTCLLISQVNSRLQTSRTSSEMTLADIRAQCVFVCSVFVLLCLFMVVRIMCRYAKFWLAFDLFTCFPYDLFMLGSLSSFCVVFVSLCWPVSSCSVWIQCVMAATQSFHVMLLCVRA